MVLCVSEAVVFCAEILDQLEDRSQLVVGADQGDQSTFTHDRVAQQDDRHKHDEKAGGATPGALGAWDNTRSD